MRRSSPTKIDRRRLRDGKTAIDRPTSIKSMSYGDLIDLRSTLFDGIAALQSCDDMGPTLNDEAMSDERILQERLAAVEKRLKEF